MIVMISQPMNGKTNEQIREERADIIKRFKELHIDVLDTIIEETADPKTYNEYHPALFYMAKSIEFMARVDAVYFAKGWQEAKGCRLEREIAKTYNVKILDEEFLYPMPQYTIKSISSGSSILQTKEGYSITNAKNTTTGEHKSIQLNHTNDILDIQNIDVSNHVPSI